MIGSRWLTSSLFSKEKNQNMSWSEAKSLLSLSRMIKYLSFIFRVQRNDLLSLCMWNVWKADVSGEGVLSGSCPNTSVAVF